MMTRFAIAMAAILFLPRLMQRFRLPGVLGFIIAGILLGPGMTAVIDKQGPAVTLLAEIGKLLFMFFVGFEIDLEEFKKNRTRAAIFGTLTFLFPFAGGVLIGRLLGYSWNGSVLIGSLISSHTLLAHSILTKYKLLQNNAVLVTVGGTIMTDIASMLVLAIIVNVHENGFSWSMLARELVQLAIFVPLIMFGLSKVARKLVIHFGQTPDARVVIMLILVAVASELAQLIDLEGIVGAFLAGIAVKRALRGKFAVEQLEVLANSLFIPTFFLTTGFLVDFSMLSKLIISKPQYVAGLLCALIVGKYLAAWCMGAIARYSSAEKGLIFSLTIPQMAATLASAVVGYEAINSAGERLLDAEFLNIVIMLVIVTCVVGPILTERFGKEISGVGTESGEGMPAVPVAE